MPDPVIFVIDMFVYVPSLCIAFRPAVLLNNALAVVYNAKSSSTNVNTKSALRPGIALAKIFTLFPLAYPLP